MNEFKANSDLPGYWATVLGFINCLILANTDLDKRVQLRNEFIGQYIASVVLASKSTTEASKVE